MSRPIKHLRWYIGGLLFLSTVINYIDRQTLSVLAPYLKTEYQWTNTDFAMVLIAFRVAYAIGQTIAGRAIDRLGTRAGPEPVGLVVFRRRDGDVAGVRAAQLRRIPVCAGARRSRQLARRDQGRLRMVPAAGIGLGRRALRQRIVDRRRARAVDRADHLPHVRKLEAGVPADRHARVPVADRVPRDLPAAGRSPAAVARKSATTSCSSDRHDGTGEPGPQPVVALWNAAPPASDLGLHPLQELHRSRVVLHHRLVRGLSRGQGIQARGEPDGFLGAVPCRRCRQLLRRRGVELPDRARLARRRGAESHRRHRHGRHDVPDPDGVDRLVRR